MARRGGARIPIHGCESGCYQNIRGAYDTALESKRFGVPVKYGEVMGGSSIVQTVELTRNGPVGATVLTYSQAENPASPWYADQTRMFSRKQWVPIRFTERAILSDPKLRVTRLSGR